MPELERPRNLVRAMEADTDTSAALAAWTAALPRTVRDAAHRWSLTLGRPFQPGGVASWVAPARTSDGEHVVLKVGWRHDEALHEADGLRLWQGRGTVRLLDAYATGSGAETGRAQGTGQAQHRNRNGNGNGKADNDAGTDAGDTSVLLLEACEPGTSLSGALPPGEQDAVAAGLLRRLWIEPPDGHAFRSLHSMCAWWADGFERRYAAAEPSHRLDPGLARTGMELFRTLPRTASGRPVLLCTDLHPENILAAQREPWLVIDPKPYVGDPAYDALQYMLNFPDRLAADPAGFARRMAGLLGLDAERLRLWLFARCVQESVNHPCLRRVAADLAP